METISRSLLTFLLNSAWQIPLIAGVAWLAARLMRNGPASHRHAVWVAALFAALPPPAASINSGTHTASQPFQAPAPPQVARSTPSTTSQSQYQSNPGAPHRFLRADHRDDPAWRVLTVPAVPLR